MAFMLTKVQKFSLFLPSDNSQGLSLVQQRLEHICDNEDANSYENYAYDTG